MLEEFQQIEIFRPSIFDIAGNLMVAFLCGMLIAMVYRFVYRGPSYSVTFVNSLVLLCMITAVVILVIGNNLARAFGLVGAMSIIRFRTAVRDVQDIIFIFFALTIGMAAGVGLPMIAIIATLLISSVIILLTSTNFAQPTRRQHLLHIRYETDEKVSDLLQKILRQYCRKVKLVNIKNLGYGNAMEAFYHVDIRNNKKKEALIHALNALDFTQTINLYFDEDDSNAPTS